MTRSAQYGVARRIRGGDNWSTPRAFYDALDAEFSFTLDPCPLDPNGGLPLLGTDGLARSWAGERVFCNPPYSEISPWLSKAREATLAVFLVPSRTGTRWFHEHALKADEVRFIRGRLKFGERGTAPFDSLILVYRSPEARSEGETK